MEALTLKADGTALARVRDALDARGLGPIRGGMARCPAHEDRTPSLQVRQGERGVLLRCYAGCDLGAVAEHLGLSTADLFDAPAPGRTNGRGTAAVRRAPRPWPHADAELEAVHAYTDRVQVCRFTAAARAEGRPKCKPRHRMSEGPWLEGLGPFGARELPLYREAAALEALAAGDTLHLVEGEGDVDAILEAGGCAATNIGGAGKFSADHAARLAAVESDSRIVVVADRDEPGEKHAASVVRHLLEAGVAAQRIQLARAAQGNDARDHLGAGLGLDRFEIEPAVVDVPDLALDVAAIRARPRGTSPLPGLLPDEPALVALIARPKAAKTRLALSIAQAAAAGVPPWPGAPPLDLGTAAILEAEEPASDTVRTLDGLAVLASPPRPGWEEGLLLYARDPLLDSRAEPLLRLDEDGLTLVRRLARSCGLLVIDSLSRAKPAAAEEIDNDHMTALLGELQRIAAEERCYLVLIHHQGHADRDDPISAGRGASAISAVARAVWHLEREPGRPWQRRLRVRGNAVPDSEITFEVSSPDAEPEGAVLYFRPVDPLEGFSLEELLPELGAECNTSELARRISGSSGEPSGSATRQAKELRRKWLREGLIEVYEGPRKAKMLRRVR